MWRVISGLLLLVSVAFGKLNGGNICPEEKRYIVNVTEYFLKNSTIRNYKWCLNVPPRCSFYTTKLINSSRLVEKEITDIIDKCCSGYQEDKETKTCLPVCPDCHNGTCKAGKCLCFPGYKGDFCDIPCGQLEWGENCKYQCKCKNKCESTTGNCLCPPGLTGVECGFQCLEGFYGLNCLNRCNCGFQTCDPVNGQCKLLLTTSNPTINFANNGKFEIDKSHIVSTIESTETSFPFFNNEDKSDRLTFNNYISSRDDSNNNNALHASTNGPVQILMKSKAKVKTKEVSVTREENYDDNDDESRGNPEVNKNDLVSSASAATAISAGIILVAAVILLANHFKKIKNEKDNDKDQNKGVSTVAVYTHSIFHTPLPEPPIFENPIFASPVESTSTGENRIETHVVCSLNFPTCANIKEQRDGLYDHPPSTGSYRAASIPEPPDIDINSSIHLEPLYDEIPSGCVPTPISQSPPSYKASTLYMNTCGKTRF